MASKLPQIVGELPQIISQYNCTICDFITRNKKDYNRHILTPKHLKKSKCYENASNLEENASNISNKTLTTTKNMCNCGKEYKHDSSYFRHKKKCILLNDPNIVENENTNIELTSAIPVMDMNVIMSVLQKNQEFQEMMMEQNKIIMEQKEIMMEQNKQLMEQNKLLVEKVGNNNTTNSHNNTQFNLQFFLNETCKNAMNVTEFLDFIKVELEDLDYTGKAGYIEGVTRIFTKNLDRLGKFEKPFWTTDEKRETIMSKEDGVWEKDEEHKQINKVISKIERKNLMQLSPWKEAHPGWQNSDKLGEFLAKIQKNIMGGEPTMIYGYPDEIKSNEKIVRNIIKKTIIPKK